MIPKNKIWILASIIVLYLLFGITVKFLVINGIISPLPPTPIDEEGIDKVERVYLENATQRLEIASNFFEENLIEENRHVNLYYSKKSLEESDFTNSEAMSYYLLWNARSRNRENFNQALDFVEKNMLNGLGYMKWKLNENEQVIDDGGNIASDADLRTVKAIFAAEDQWENPVYEKLRKTITDGMEKIVVTKEGYFLPYGGYENNALWNADEVWLSYSDFNAFRKLAYEEGVPWTTVYDKMKELILSAQLENGLYYTRYKNGNYDNFLDGGDHSINSLWVMVRAAESSDVQLRQSARKSLDFYMKKYWEDGMIFTSYDSNGKAQTQFDAAWVYALVGRTAIELGEDDFADVMIAELMNKQVIGKDSEFYGAFPEDENKVGQFTMQESIITLQRYLGI